MKNQVLLGVAFAVIVLGGGIIVADRMGWVEILPDRAASQPRSGNAGSLRPAPGMPGMPQGMPGMPGPGGMGMPGMPPGMPGMAQGVPAMNPGTPTKSNKEVVGPMIDLLMKDKDEAVRYQAAYTLGNLGAEAVEPLLEVLKAKDRDAKAKARAAYALGLVGPAANAALPELLKELQGAPTEEYRRFLLFALSRIVAESRPAPPAEVLLATDNVAPARRVLDPGLP